MVEVQAARSWDAVLKHRIYSCPDTPRFDFVLDATCLILKKRDTGAHVRLEIRAVVNVAPDHSGQLDGLSELFSSKLMFYKEAVKGISGVWESKQANRVYFLSDEPWPEWLQKLTIPNPNTEWAATLSIYADPESFFEWPQVGTLFWPGVVRGGRDQKHNYPSELKKRLARLGLSPDERNNGPAIVAYLAAGGKRPVWVNEGWPIHHIYDGSGPINGDPVLNAVSDGRYFTHSAGLVAAHPVAHHLAHHDKSMLLKWLLRREAFLRFGFDPGGVFADAK